MEGNYLRLIPGLCLEDNKLIGKFKMATGDVISIRGQVMEYTYIPTGIKRELEGEIWCGSRLLGLLEEDQRQTLFSFTHIGKFKMAASDVISIKGQVMEYTYIPTGIKTTTSKGSWRVRFSVDRDCWKRTRGRLFLVSPT